MNVYGKSIIQTTANAHRKTRRIEELLLNFQIELSQYLLS